jgi:predicted nuclease with TOPRIM domain
LEKENAALRAEVEMFKERWELEQIRYEGISAANDELRARVERMENEYVELQNSKEALRARLALLEKGLMAVDGLISESRGVDGLHLNGDVALWEDLRTGGVYEEWLRDYDAALAALKEEGWGR